MKRRLYDYNAAGMRIRHLNSSRGDVEYIYDGRSILEERDLANEELLAHYRYTDRLISLTTPSNEQFYHYSSLGTTANLSNDAGEIQTSYRTDAWGRITKEEGASVNRQVFTGQEHDSRTGLVYFGARYYDPDTARFINQDSYLGQGTTPPSLHRYLYAYGNPTVYVDLTGYATIKEMMGVDSSSVDAAIGAGETSAWDAAKYAGKQTFYSVWNFVSLGFLERQDDRRYKYDRGQISEREFHGATFGDAGATALGAVAGGGVASRVTAKLGGGTLANLAGVAAGDAVDDLTVQSGQVLTHHATDGRLGSEQLSATEAVVAATLSVAVKGAEIKVKSKITSESSKGPNKQSGDSLASTAKESSAKANSFTPIKYKNDKLYALLPNKRGGNYRSWFRKGEGFSGSSAIPINSPSTLHTRGNKPGIGERALTKKQYKALMSRYRSRGPALKRDLEKVISQQDYVYRATTQRMVDVYRKQGSVRGRSGGTYMTTDDVGLNPQVLMDRGQVFSHWGEPEVLLRIPTSAIENATVPRSLGNSLSVGWEPFTEFYPAAGSGGMRQFLGTTNTWSDDWITYLKK